MKKYYSIYAVVAAMLLTACTQDVTESGGITGDSRVVTFTAQTVTSQDETRSASLPDALPLTGDGLELWLMPSETSMVSEATRGTQINSVEALNNFGVSAYRHGAIPTEKTLNEYLTDNNLKPDFFYNLEATKITDTQKFKLTKDFFWPTNDDVLSFFAYAPYGDENVELSAATVDGPQSINFKVDTDVKKQVDLITAQASTTSHLNTSTTPSVALNFTHQLTGIRFVIGDQFLKGWIKSISLKGVYTQGTYTIGGGWTLDDTKKGNFTISYNLDKPVAGTPGEEVSASDEVFMMIPHTFAEDDAATIEVVYNDKYTDYVVSCPLKGQTWKAGKTVTYAITSNKLTTLRIGQIQFATTPEGAPKRIWAAGDKIGMYVVSADGKKLKHKNVPVTYDGVNWNIDHTTAEGTIYKLAGESFYFYYPYSNVSNGQPTGYPEQCPELKAEAPVFFQGVIDYSTIKTDQSTLDNFLASDLQVARAEDDGHASMIKATMLRQRGIAVLTLGTKSAKKKVTFTNGSTTGTVNETANVTATSVFASGGNKPYQNGTKYYYYTQPNVSTSFNSATTEKEAWHEALVFNLAAGATTTLTAYSDRAYWDYINAVWNYEYTSSNYYTLKVASQGSYSYTLECWGAQGGSCYSLKGGYGAYAIGKATLTAGETVYVMVGQQGRCSNGGNYTSYPNGGRGVCGYGCWCGAGGGSTHIATVSSLPKDMKSNYTTTLLILAGGGGGATCHDPNGNGKELGWNGEGGHAGGISGNTGTCLDGGYAPGTGGTQTAGGKGGWKTYDQPAKDGAFGIGSMATGESSGGGGGLYGGGGSWGAGAGGGSSYIGNSRLTDKKMVGYNCATSTATATKTVSVSRVSSTPTADYAKSGAGYCRITLTRW